MSKIKVVHYINQFFAQIGGEEKADYPAELRVGEIVGPGQALTQQFGEEAEIVATIVCGDSYFNETLTKQKLIFLKWLRARILISYRWTCFQCWTLRCCMRNYL